ncbi:MAG: radical SAM protein [Opitutaceae bacterium]
MSAKLYSWSRFALRTAGAAAGWEARPTKLNFVVTKRCYSRCVYCDIWKIKETPGALDSELTLDEIRSVAAANPFLQWIDFTGGEPTDRPDFVEVVQAFASACPDLLLTHFPTNGIATKRIEQVVRDLHASLRPRLGSTDRRNSTTAYAASATTSPTPSTPSPPCAACWVRTTFSSA